MAWSLLVDVLLIGAFVLALINGYRAGLLRSASGLIGLIAGGVGAFFVIPLAVQWIPAPEWRTAGAVGAGLICVLVGGWLGAVLGRTLRRGVRAVRLGMIDRLLGAVGGVLVTAFVTLLVGSSVASLGVPIVSPAVGGSLVVRGLDQITPAPARTFIAQLRTATVDRAIPWLVQALDTPTEAPALPDHEMDQATLDAAADSIVRITGSAYQCGQTMSGSGFVVAPDRIVTNAHVVAGVDEPIVDAPGEPLAQGRVVYYDHRADLAVIATDGLATEPLPLTGTLGAGAAAVVVGYPFGGPMTAEPAEVLSAGPQVLQTELGLIDREAYTLATQVDPGNSGGPLLAVDGTVAGVVFGKAETVDNVGYAVTMAELAPVADASTGLAETVDSGQCVRS
jgi:S1-C subfamily serine protease